MIFNMRLSTKMKTMARENYIIIRRYIVLKNIVTDTMYLLKWKEKNVNVYSNLQNFPS